MNNVIIGYNSYTTHNNCCLIGDELVGRYDGDLQVGDTLFGKPLSDELECAFQEYGDCLKEMMEIIFFEMVERLYGEVKVDE